ncbi:MAG TPA: M20/M25/M40 family metallo-hydrolase [Kofleriaceae bacterium]|nr:M20/M25/M40 family metallo-hydrolase [Kofleriaceae bacterium]
MRTPLVALAVLLLGCGDNSATPTDAALGSPLPPPPDADLHGLPAADPALLQKIFNEVDGDRIVKTLRETSGVDPVMINGQMVTIDQRFDDAGRKRFRDYFTQTMTGLGLEVHDIPYQAAGHPRPGNDVEAVLRGTVDDSFVVIVHYDSIGPKGLETQNPGADDDMTGMAILFETARLFAAHHAEIPLTVRFVASDEEELGGLGGARFYAASITAQAKAGGFAVVAAVDDEQSGWNCSKDNRCGDNVFPAIDIFSCGSTQDRSESFDFPQLGNQFEAIVHQYSTLNVKRGCLGANSDHFAMWERGVPAIVYSEHNPFANPHFDREGGDTFDKIDTDYLISIARPAITFQAQLVRIHAPPP